MPPKLVNPIFIKEKNNSKYTMLFHSSPGQSRCSAGEHQCNIADPGKHAQQKNDNPNGLSLHVGKHLPSQAARNAPDDRDYRRLDSFQRAMAPEVVSQHVISVYNCGQDQHRRACDPKHGRHTADPSAHPASE